MKAIFEVEFKAMDMIDQESLDKVYKGSWLRCMRALYKSEGLGIFSKQLKLVGIKK